MFSTCLPHVVLPGPRPTPVLLLSANMLLCRGEFGRLPFTWGTGGGPIVEEVCRECDLELCWGSVGAGAEVTLSLVSGTRGERGTVLRSGGMLKAVLNMAESQLWKAVWKSQEDHAVEAAWRIIVDNDSLACLRIIGVTPSSESVTAIH